MDLFKMLVVFDCGIVSCMYVENRHIRELENVLLGHKLHVVLLLDLAQNGIGQDWEPAG